MTESTATVAQRLAPGLLPALDVALEIRAFETVLLELFERGLLAGTVHTCVGQEWCAAALHPHLRLGVDAFFASHRGHGHYLAYGGPKDRLLAELMGREGAICAGRGGTQNLHYRRFFSAGIQGGNAPIAVGYAWALARRGEPALAVVQLGDGTLGEGTLYEAFTFAAARKAPVLFLLEHNGWAQSTDTRATTPGDILQRARGFGLEADWKRDDDPEALRAHLGRVVALVRRGRPFLQVIETRRLAAHSKGDDSRPKEVVEALWKTDPLALLLSEDADLRERLAGMRDEVRALAEEIAARPLLEKGTGTVIDWAEAGHVCEGPEKSPGSQQPDRGFASMRRPGHPAYDGAGTLHADSEAGVLGRVSEELNRALHALMAEHADVVVIGEDLLDPYGGAFKVTRGLSTRFPERVLATPVAEAAIVGFGNGLALAGMKPVAEIMFADFATLAADQLINFAAKFESMYAGQVRCPLTVRLVSGGRRGYGPTHSQSLETLFCGVPGLRVVALSRRHHPGCLLRQAVLDDSGPKVFVENKLLYALRPAPQPPVDLVEAAHTRHADYPALSYRPRGGRDADVTLVTYGGSTDIVEAAMRRRIEDEETRFDYVVLTQLWPLDVAAVVDSVKRTRRLVVVEESVPTYGVGAAVIAAVVQQVTGAIACRAVGALPVPLPAVRHLEDRVLPSAERVADAIAALS